MLITLVILKYDNECNIYKIFQNMVILKRKTLFRI